jgi:hypothetical protein
MPLHAYASLAFLLLFFALGEVDDVAEIHR